MRKWLYILICLGTIFRFFYPIFSHPLDHLYSDPARHHDNVLEENFGKSLGSVLDPPLPQLFFLALKCAFNDSLIGTSLFFGLLCCTMPWFWYLWAKEAFQTKEKALIFTTIIIWLPSWMGIYSYYMDEIFLLPLMGAAMWLTWRAKRKMTYPSFFLASFFWALTVATKLNTAFEVMIIFPWLCMAFYRKDGYNWRTLCVMALNAMIIFMGYLNYPIWVYKGMGSTWLFPPGQSALNRACFLSGASKASLTFTRGGKEVGCTGFFMSNAVLCESLPFCHWITWRKGEYNQTINLDQKFYLIAPGPSPSIETRLIMMAESAIFFFFSRSWTDDRGDDFVQQLQIDLRLLWFPLFLCILALARQQNAMRNILVVLVWGTACLYIFTNGSTIIEGRYRKPWEGLAIAAFIYLLPNSFVKSIGKKNTLASDQA